MDIRGFHFSNCSDKTKLSKPNRDRRGGMKATFRFNKRILKINYLISKKMGNSSTSKRY